MTVRFKRGNEANLPRLVIGEPALTLDTSKVFIGGLYDNVELPTKIYVDSQLAQKVTVSNVKKFGAKGDGVTNDYQAITDAITDAVNSGGGIVYFPEGTYLINTKITLPAVPIEFTGSGWKTIIKANATMSAVLHKPIGAVSGMKISNMQIDGNRLAQYCIWLEQANLTDISGVNLQYFLYAGFYAHTDDVSVSGAIQYETFFHHSKITGLSGSGLPEDRPSYGIYLGTGATDSHFHDIVIRNVKEAHVRSNSGNNIFARIHNFGYPEPSFSAKYGFDLVSGRTYLSQIYNDGLPIGIKARDGFFSVTNSFFYWRLDLSYPEKATYSGVEVDAICTDYVISNNIFRGDAGYDVKLLGTRSGSVLGNTSISILNKIEQFHRPKIQFDDVEISGWATVGRKEILNKGNRPVKINTVQSGWANFTAVLDTAQPDMNYHVMLSSDWNAGYMWISSQTTTGFTVNWATNPTATQKFVYEVVRP